MGKDLEVIGGAMRVGLFNNGLEARCLIMDQAVRLLAAQGDTYQPFISMTVNNALQNVLKADTNLQNLYGLLFGDKGTNIQINNHNNPTTNNQYLTPEKAVTILIDKGNNGLIRNEDMKASLKLQIGTSDPDLPEVIATKQIGFQNDSIPTLKAQNFNAINHDNRNEVDGDIMDADEIL
jgi:hypothetical protein